MIQFTCNKCGGTGRYIVNGRDQGPCYACNVQSQHAPNNPLAFLSRHNGNSLGKAVALVGVVWFGATLVAAAANTSGTRAPTIIMMPAQATPVAPVAAVTPAPVAAVTPAPVRPSVKARARAAEPQVVTRIVRVVQVVKAKAKRKHKRKAKAKAKATPATIIRVVSGCGCGG